MCFKVHFHFIGNLWIPLPLSLRRYENLPQIGDFRFWATRSQRSRQKCRDLHNLMVHILENTCRHIMNSKYHKEIRWLTMAIEISVIWIPLSTRKPSSEESNQINCPEYWLLLPASAEVSYIFENWYFSYFLIGILRFQANLPVKRKLLTALFYWSKLN